MSARVVVSAGVVVSTFDCKIELSAEKPPVEVPESNLMSVSTILMCLLERNSLFQTRGQLQLLI